MLEPGVADPRHRDQQTSGERLKIDHDLMIGSMEPMRKAMRFTIALGAAAAGAYLTMTGAVAASFPLFPRSLP
ncbi:MAG: hypothetical protein KJ824_09990 [Alphaproteobacteria bacterium]|nr:hypothetical protein [Alphaproteobacteria bacterium]